MVQRAAPDMGQVLAQVGDVLAGQMHPVKLHILRCVIVLRQATVQQDNIALLGYICLVLVVQPKLAFFDQDEQKAVHILAVDLISVLAVIMAAAIYVIKKALGQGTYRAEMQL